MGALKDLRLWLNAYLVLFYGVCFAQVRTAGHMKRNHTMFNHAIQYQEARAKVVYTLSGNDNNAACVFPFIYLGKTYTECTGVDCKHKKTWCATTSNYDKDKLWGHCQTDEDVMDCMDRHSSCGEWALRGDCVTNAAYMCSKCPRSCGLCTHGGNGQGRGCSFPFFFNKNVVYDCLPFNKKSWCATTTDYNSDKRWGYCFPKLFKDMKAVNKKHFNWGECDDQNKNCGTWAAKGLCTSEPQDMDKMCPWSCHKCAPEILVTQEKCNDYSSMCKMWATRGDCFNMPIFMFAFCRWTCRRCAKSSIQKTAHDRMPDQCSSWAVNGDCLTNEEFMMQNCRSSCKTGGYVNGRMCLDKIAKCPEWARKGYCNDRYKRNNMRRYCLYSCGWCSYNSTENNL